MSYGTKIRNNNNQIVIDQDYQNLSIVRTGKVTITDDGVIISYKGKTPLFFIVPTSKPVTVIPKLRTDGTIDYSLIASTWYGDNHSSVTISYVIFDVGASSSDKYGMRVYNATGAVVFDSGRKYMRVKDIIPASNVFTSTYPIPSGKTYGFCICGPNFGVETDYDDGLGFASLLYYDLGIVKSSKGVYFSSVSSGQSPYIYSEATALYYDTEAPCLVIDLTDYI